MAPAASPTPAALRFAAAETSTDTAPAAASTATPAVLTPAGISTAPPPLENEDGEKLYAKVTLEVLVYLGYDEGISTPDVYEPPYPYMVARTAEMTSVEIIGDPEMGIIIEHGAADDFDPDDLLVSEVKNDDGINFMGVQQPPLDAFPGRVIPEDDGFEDEAPITCFQRPSMLWNTGCGYMGTVGEFRVPEAPSIDDAACREAGRHKASTRHTHEICSVVVEEEAARESEEGFVMHHGAGIL